MESIPAEKPTVSNVESVSQTDNELQAHPKVNAPHVNCVESSTHNIPPDLAFHSQDDDSAEPLFHGVLW